MAKTSKCPECGELFDPRGLRSHRLARHVVNQLASDKTGEPKSNAAASVASPPPSATGDAAGTTTPPRTRPRSAFDVLGDLWGKSR